MNVFETENGPAVLITDLGLRIISMRQGTRNAIDAADEAFPNPEEAKVAVALALGADQALVILATEIREALTGLLVEVRAQAGEVRTGMYL